MAEKRKKSGSGILIAVFVLIGVVCGFAISYVFDLSFLRTLEPVERFLSYALILLLMWLGYMVQVLLHELGHLIGGLASGYRFSSYRIGKWMLIRIDGKLTFRRFSLAGTGGQCLMIPVRPHSVALFHLGGAIFNLLFGGAFLALWLLLDAVIWFEIFFAACAVFGLFFAILNGVPFRTSLIANDGSNLVAMKKNPHAAEQFDLHLRMNAMSVDGVRLRDMPAEWFAFPTEEQLKNNAYAETAVFACNRLLDEQRFAEAAEKIEFLLAADTAMAGVHRKLLICDLIYCEAVGAQRREVFVRWMDREQMNFIRSMKEFPSVIRTEYAYTRLLQNEPIRANTIKKRFEKCILTYPNRGDILTEQSLIRHADSIEAKSENEE